MPIPATIAIARANKIDFRRSFTKNVAESHGGGRIHGWRTAILWRALRPTMAVVAQARVARTASLDAADGHAWVQLGVTQRCNRSRVIFGVSTGRVRRTESIGASSSFGLAVELDVCARMLEMLADENRTPTVHLGGGGNARRQSGNPLNLPWMPSRTAAIIDSATYTPVAMPPGSATPVVPAP